LNMDTSQMNSPTNLTLNIRNSGVAGVALVAYTVKDEGEGGYQYSKTSWTGPYLNPNQVVAVNFFIDGGAFTFHSGSWYYVTVTSAPNNLFTFSVRA